MKTDFKIKQSEFAAYIRDPFIHNIPVDIKPARMQIYRELFFNNIDSFLSSNFPVLNTILDKSQWFELVQDFFSHHTCHTPHFSEIPEEFLDFLANERNNPSDHPFLLELAHYEWIEMALSIAQDEITPNLHTSTTSLIDSHLSLSPLAIPLAYQYPVQLISASYLPDQPPPSPTFLLVYRDLVDDVHFMLITAQTFALLQLLQQHQTMRCRDCLLQITQQITHEFSPAIQDFGLQLIQQLVEKNIILTVK